jgi:hemolysin activation/secretion protein
MPECAIPADWLGAARILVLGILLSSSVVFGQTGSSTLIAVSGYRIEGDNPLSTAVTQAILAPFVGEGLTIDQLQAAAAALESALTNRGYSFLRVVVPPQEAHGVITLRVLSFRLNVVQVVGNHHFNEDNVQYSLPSLEMGKTPNLRDIARNQAHVNEHSAKQVRVTLKEGAVIDTIDADVQVEDSNPLQVFATLDNSGSRQMGRTRLGVGIQHANLFNLDHTLTATYNTAPEHPGEVRQYGFYYRAPVYRLGGTLSAYYSHSKSNSGTVAQFFQVSGSGEFKGVRWSQWLQPIGAYSHAFDIGLEDRLFNNNVSFFGTPLATDVRSRPVLLRYEGGLDGVGYQWRHGVEYVHNIRGGGSSGEDNYSGNRDGADPGWNALRFELRGSWAISKWVASARLHGQYSGDALIPGEQFALGGAALVRGLEEREGTGDTGYVVSLEMISPEILPGVRALGFFDQGAAHLRGTRGTASTTEHTSSVGLGLRGQWERHVTLSLDWAHVLDGTETTHRGDNFMHAALSIRY